MEPHGWGFGNTSGWVGTVLHLSFGLRQELGPKICFRNNIGWQGYFSRLLSGIVQVCQRQRYAQVSDYLEWVNDKVYWNPGLTREAQDWELGVNGFILWMICMMHRSLLMLVINRFGFLHPKKDFGQRTIVGSFNEALRLLPSFLESAYRSLSPILEFLSLFGRWP